MGGELHGKDGVARHRALRKFEVGGAIPDVLNRAADLIDGNTHCILGLSWRQIAEAGCDGNSRERAVYGRSIPSLIEIETRRNEQARRDVIAHGQRREKVATGCMAVFGAS